MSLFGAVVNVKAIAKEKLDKLKKMFLSIDINHNGIPDIIEVEQDLEHIFEDLKFLESKLTPAEILCALNVLFPGKFSMEEVTKLENAVVKLIALEPRIEKLVEASKEAFEKTDL